MNGIPVPVQPGTVLRVRVEGKITYVPAMACVVDTGVFDYLDASGKRWCFDEPGLVGVLVPVSLLGPAEDAWFTDQSGSLVLGIRNSTGTRLDFCDH
jgi:hypothetical protein